MAARYVEIDVDEMSTFMTERGFEARTVIDKGREVGREVVYERDRTKEGEVVVRIWSSIAMYDGAARDVGQDAIRVQLVWVGKGKPFRSSSQRPASNLGKVLYACTRVHRTQGWKEKLDGRMREAWLAMRSVKKCPKCEKLPMTERTRKDGTGTFLGCSGYPGCNGTMSIREEERHGEPGRQHRAS